MQAAGGDGDELVAGLHARGAEQRAARHDAHGEAREIVLALRVHSGQLGRFAAEQRATRQAAALGDARNDAFRHVHIELGAREVVEEEQRPCAGGDHVVDAHRHQILSDAAVYARGERDLELRADAVGAAYQERVLDTARQGAEAGEAADVLDDLGDARAPCQRFDALDQRLTGADIDARLPVRDRHQPRP